MTVRRPLLGGLIGLLALTAALVAPATTFAATPTASTVAAATAACTDGHWPASVQGVPTAWHVGGAAGDYVWHDATGWHLRVTHRGTGKVVFSGRIVSSAPITSAVAVHLEGSDSFALSADKLTLTYRFTNYGKVDGLNFRTDCARRAGVRRVHGCVEAADRPDLGRSRQSPPAPEPVRGRPRALSASLSARSRRDAGPGIAALRFPGIPATRALPLPALAPTIRSRG